MQLKKFETDDFKLEVIELDGFKFITTFWLKNYELEDDRKVYQFETYGGAIDKAFDLLVDQAELG